MHPFKRKGDFYDFIGFIFLLPFEVTQKVTFLSVSVMKIMFKSLWKYVEKSLKYSKHYYVAQHKYDATRCGMQLWLRITLVFNFTCTLFCNEIFILATQIVLWIRNATSIFFIPVQLTATTLALKYNTNNIEEEPTLYCYKSSEWPAEWS